MAVRRIFLQEDDILCELYADTRSDVSDYSDNESLDSDRDVSTTSSRKQLRSFTGPLNPQFPHPFGYSKFGPYMNILYRNLGQYTAQNKNCYWKKP